MHSRDGPSEPLEAPVAGCESGSTLMSKSDTFHEPGGFRTLASEPRAPSHIVPSRPPVEEQETPQGWEDTQDRKRKRKRGGMEEEEKEEEEEEESEEKEGMNDKKRQHKEKSEVRKSHFTSGGGAKEEKERKEEEEELQPQDLHAGCLK